MKSNDDQLIVITGAAGFIGSHLVRHLNEKGLYNLLLVDDLKRSIKWKNLVGKRFFDLKGKADFLPWLKDNKGCVKAILHMGACSSTVEEDAGYLLENNYRYSQKIAEVAIEEGIRFIYASSGATYGMGEAGFSDDENALFSLQPKNMYGYSKHLFDLWLYQNDLLKKAVGLKFFNVFGPNESHKGRMASVLFHWTKAIQEGGKVSLFCSSEPDKYADGHQKRDFIDVDDVARMTVSFLDNSVGGIYNIGRGIPTPWMEVAEALFQALKKPLQIEWISMPQDLLGKYQNYTCADMAKTKKALGVIAETAPLQLSVDRYCNQFLLKDRTW